MRHCAAAGLGAPATPVSIGQHMYAREPISLGLEGRKKTIYFVVLEYK